MATAPTMELIINNETELPQDAISLESLNDTATPIDVPSTPTPTDTTGVIDAGLTGILQDFQAESQEEKDKGDLEGRILESMDVLGGRSTKLQELEGEAGLEAQRKDLQGVINQLQGLQKEAAATPLQIQQESIGRGRTRGGVAPIQTARLRENAIKSLGLAAIGQTLQGNISLAEATIQRALDAEFEPEESRLEILKQLYEFNKADLERVDKKRADMLNIRLDERARKLEIDKINKGEIYNIGVIAQQNGAPSSIVQKAFTAGTKEEAMAIIAEFSRSPESKIALENARLDGVIKRQKIQEQTLQLQYLKEFDGLTPKEYATKLDADKKAISEAKTESDKALLQGQAIDKQVILIDSVLDSKAIDSVVGPTALARGSKGLGGVATRTALGAATGAAVGAPFGGVGAIPGAIIGAVTFNLPGAIDNLTGSADKLVGKTEQFISQLFLESLIAVKARGATFGALQKAEQDALTNAATFIGNRRICSDGGRGICGEGEHVVGYDMSETDFKREMGEIRKYARIAYERATGESFTSGEKETLNEIFNNEAFNPAFNQ